MGKKRNSLVLMFTLLIMLAFSSQALADDSSEDSNVDFVQNTEEFNEKAKKSKDVFGKKKDLDVNEILDELGLKKGVAIKSDSQNDDYFGVIKVKNEKIPVYISSDEIQDEKAVKKALIQLKKFYKAELAVENSSELVASINPILENAKVAATEPSFSKVGTTLKLNTSSNGTKFWYTEYRSYEDPDFSSSEDVFWLRADHQSFPVDDPIFEFTATWTANGDILDPKPASKSNVSTSISWSIPPSISMSTELSAEDDDDVKLTTDTYNDKATWVVNNKMWSGIHQNMHDFNFTHGYQIEAPTSQNGFTVNVSYNRVDMWYGEKTWSDKIKFYESTDNLTWTD